MKTEGLLEEIKSRLDIVDVISDYIELKRAGKNHKGLCPFHSEKTPSFMVNSDKQIFHCFGCSAGGDIITFVKRYENLSLPEALKFLAKKAGIDPKRYTYEGKDKESGLKDSLIAVNNAAAAVFKEGLKRSETALSYLKKRGLTGEMISRFSLGYAPKSWQFLLNSLKAKGFSEAIILKAGLAASGEKGIYDIFRDRITFSINDDHGATIAFGGRVMDSSEPKYLNSPDTPLFKKSETLYALNIAKDGIRKTGHVIIAEGYLDVIACHKHGFTNVVAPLGTALTAGHLQKLRRFTKKAVMVFDGDSAGKAAAKRSLPLLLEHGFSSGMLLLPEGDDPDSFLEREGAQAFSALLDKAHSPIEFLVRVSKKDKTGLIHEAVEIITAAGDTIMKETLLRELAEKAGISEAVIREEIKRTCAKNRLRSKRDVPPEAASRQKTVYDEETLLLSTVLTFPEKYSAVMSLVSLEEFKNLMVRGLLQKLRGSTESVNSLLAALSDDEKNIVTRLTVNPGFDREDVDKNIADCVKKIIMRRFDEQIKDARSSGDLKTLSALLSQRHNFTKGERVSKNMVMGEGMN